MSAASMAQAPPADAAARERALDPSASFVVQAPAGSGKTELLVRRMLRLLATATRPEAVVAMTFTRKAAQQLGTRVRSRLRRLAGARLLDDLAGPDEDGVPAFDVTLVGMGEEGHPLSVFPDSPAVHEQAATVVAVFDCPKPPPTRKPNSPQFARGSTR